MAHTDLEIRRSSASLWGEKTGMRHLPVGLEVHRHHDLHRVQGLRGGVPGVERPEAGAHAADRAPTRRCPTLDAEFWNLIRFNEQEFDGGVVWLMRKDQCMHCEDPGLPRGVPRAGRHRPVRERHRGRQPGAVHRLRLLRDRAAPSTCPRSTPKTGKMAKCTLCVDRVVGGPGARVHQGLPDRLPAVRDQGRHGGARPLAGRAAQGQRLRRTPRSTIRPAWAARASSPCSPTATTPSGTGLPARPARPARACASGSRCCGPSGCSPSSAR